MRALGNGLYEIENRNTGEKRVVTAADLPKYGLSAPQQAVQTQQVAPLAPQQSQSAGNNILGFLANLIIPRTKRMGEDVLASAQTADYGRKMTGTGSASDIASQIQQAKKSGNADLLKQLLAKSKQISGKGDLIQAPQFSQDIGLGYLDRGIGVGTELGTLLGIPAMGLSGAKAGALAGGLLGLSKPGASASDRLVGGGTGAVTGAITGKILDKLLGVKGTGKDLRKGVVNPKVSPKDPFGAEKEAKIVEGLNKMGIKGSASQQREQIPGKMRELTNKIMGIFKSKNPSTKITTVTDKIDEALNNLINYDPSISGYESARDKLTNQIISQANKGKTGLTISAKGIYTAKQNLGKQLTRAFGKKGPLTPQEEVGMAIWGVLDDLLPSGAKELSRQQSILYQASPGLYANVGKGGIKLPFLGNKIGGEMIQKGKDMTGRILEGVGGGIESLGLTGGNLSPLLQNILKGERTLSQQPQNEQQQTGTQYQGDISGQNNVQHGQSVPSSFTKEKLVMAIIADPKNKTTYEAIYKLMNPSEVMSAAAQKRKLALDSAEGVYNLVEQLALEAPAGLTGSAKALLGKLPGVEGGSAEDLDRVTDGLAKAIAGALAGEVGVATDKDVARWKGLMPKTGDTMEERLRALNRLKQAIIEGRQMMRAEDEL